MDESRNEKTEKKQHLISTGTRREFGNLDLNRFLGGEIRMFLVSGF